MLGKPELSLPLLSTVHPARTGGTKPIFDVGPVLLPEMTQGTHHRIGCGLSETTQTGVLDQVTQLIEFGQIRGGAGSVGNFT
jgi:hypothetical protein